MIFVFGFVLTTSSLLNVAAHVDIRLIIVNQNGEEFHLHRESSHLTFTSWLGNVTYTKIKQGISYGICNSKSKVWSIGEFDGTKYTILQLVHALSVGDYAYSKLLLEIAESHKQKSEILINWLQSTYMFPLKDMFRLIKNVKFLEDNFYTSYPDYVHDVVISIAETNSLFGKSIEEGEFALARWLIDSGCRLSGLRSDMIDLLWKSNQNELLKYALVNAGVNNLSFLKNFSALDLLKNETFVEFLIEFESILDYLLNSNAINVELVLSKAIDKNNTKIVDKYKDGLSLTDRSYSSVLLHSAVKGGQVDLVKNLVELGSSLDVVDEVGKTPLYKAIQLENEEIVEVLLQGGANTKTPRSLLSTAVFLRDPDMVRKLIKLNCLRPDDEGWTTLQKAVENDDVEIVAALGECLHDFSNVTLVGKSLVHIVLNGSSVVLEKILDLGVNVDLPDGDDNTPLCIAAGMTDRMKILLLAEYGANISQSCAFGNTALHFAVSKSSYSIVRVLVALGANVNITNSDDQSPLYIAAMVNSSKIIAHLVSKGADIHFSTKNGNTLLHAAAIDGSTNALDTILGFGIDVNVTNYAGESPIYSAVKNNQPSVVVLLASKRANIHELTSNGDTLLHVSVDYDSIDAMITLITLGLKIETLNKMCQSPISKAILSDNYEMVWKMINNTVSLVFRIDLLLLAASSGSLESLRALTDYLNLFKLNIDSEDLETGRTPLSEAVEGNHVDVVRFLVNNGANINFRSRTGNSLVHLAAINGSTETLGVLHEFELPIDSPNNNGETPLWLATKHGHFESLKLLNELGADVRFRGTGNWENGSLLLPAAFSGNERIVSWLLSQGFFVDDADILGVTGLQEAATCGRDKIAQLLLDNSADVDKADINGMTPLHNAAYNGHAIVAEKLIAYGASLNVQAVNFLTPMHQAATNGHLSIVRLLCSHKADMNAQDVRGWTSLHWAAYKGHTQIARELVTSGANINVKCIQGSTPLQVAKNRKHKDVENLLTESGGIT